MHGANAAFGLIAAALWGGGDFAGSLAVRRLGNSIRAALAVVLCGHVLSLALVASLAMSRGEAFPHSSHLWWGVFGGAVSAISLVGFYMALADGHMGSAAAVSGLLCAAVPAVVSGMTEGAPGLPRLLGFLLAGAAIWLIAGSSEHHATSRKAMVLATLSGVGFGFYFVSLKAAGQAGLLWGMGSSRMGSSSMAALLLCVFTLWGTARQESRPEISASTVLWLLAGAAMDTLGNVSFLAATRAGRLDVAAVLASIYPATTILLAAALLKERTSPTQKWGMALALPAVVLITL